MRQRVQNERRSDGSKESFRGKEVVSKRFQGHREVAGVAEVKGRSVKARLLLATR